METNLYKLPKDILIKLIITIEEDTRKKYENEIYKLKTNIMLYGDIYECKFCDRYDVWDRNTIYPCDICFKDCCRTHNKGKMPFIYCMDCYNTYKK